MALATTCFTNENVHSNSLIGPAYSDDFRCIGPACEDTCCKGWVVPVDQVAYGKLQSLPAGKLRTLIDASILLHSEGENPPAAKFATIRMTGSQQCPLLAEDGLCRIQAEVGEAFLPHTCATYPRVVHLIGTVQEKALALSCPEAARLVLLNPDLLRNREDDCPNLPRNSNSPYLPALGEGPHSLQFWFWPIRRFVIDLVRNRAYPIWQRLFLLGVFCRNLDSLTKQGKLDGFPELLQDFQATISTGTPRLEMDKLPVNWPAHLDIVLRLAGMMLHSSNIHPRFVDCVQAFTAGIGNGPQATFECLTDHYARAHDRVFVAFFDRHPYILENYLLNTVFRCLFPFGRDGVRPGAAPSMIGEHTRLIAQFALMRGMLIGVAGFHGETFCAEHVVHTVQAASKHFEHHSEFLDQAYALLTENRMEGERGAAILGNTGIARPLYSTAASS